MRKLVESTLVSLDGVVEAPNRWSNFDEESAARALTRLDDFDAFVMGRVTYEKIFAGWSRGGGNPYIDGINAMPKYVASRSLTEAEPNVTLLGPDAAEAIRRLKEQPRQGSDQVRHQPPR